MRNEIDLSRVDSARVPRIAAATPVVVRHDVGDPDVAGQHDERLYARQPSAIPRSDNGEPDGQRNGSAVSPRLAPTMDKAGASRRPAAREAVSGRAWRALTVAALGTVLVGFNSTATNIALPSIRASFAGATATAVAWGVAGYMIGTASFLPLAGRLSDRIGRKRMFQAGLVLFACSAVLSAAAPTVWTLNLARVLQALGGAAILPASLSLVLPLFPESRRTTAVGLWSAAGPLAAAVAPMAASLVLSLAGWRVLYLLSAPVAALMFLAGLWILNELPLPPTQQRLDMLGATAGTVALAAIVAAVMQGRTWGYTAPVTLAVAAAGVLALGLFLFNSQRHPEPLLNLHLLRRRGVWVTNLSNFLIGISSQSLWLLWPFFLAGVWGYSVGGIGLALMPGPITAGISTVLFSRLGERGSVVWLCRTGACLQLASTGWMIVALGTTAKYWLTLAPAIALFGIGWGMCVPLLNSLALQAVEDRYFGEINGLFNTLRYAASAIGIAALFALLQEDSGAGALAYYQHALVFFLVTTVAAVLSLWIPIGRSGRPGRPHTDER